MPRHFVVLAVALIATLSLLAEPSSAATPPAPRRSLLPQVPLPPSFVYAGEQLVFDGRDLRGGAGTVVTLQARTLAGRLIDASAETDERGRFTVALDATALTVGEPIDITVVIETEEGTWRKLRQSQRTKKTSVSNRVVEPDIAPDDPATNFSAESCTSCSGCAEACSTEIFNLGNEPTSEGVQTVDGATIDRFLLTEFGTRRLGFELTLFRQSMTHYDGPVGQAFSHSFNMHIAQTGPDRAVIATADLRTFDLARLGQDPEVAGREVWSAPEGFYSRLERDEILNRWILTLHSGCRFEFLLSTTGLAGPLVAIEDPNGNRTELRLDPSGLLETAETDLGQEVRLEYDGDEHLSAVTDPIGRTTRLAYDAMGRLVSITSPETETADIAAGDEITDADLPDVLTVMGRRTLLAYDDPRFPTQITRITDPRGAVPIEYIYDGAGRVQAKRINGREVRFIYGPPSGGPPPKPLPVLEPDNRLTRVIDREGNVTDYETLGPLGNPRRDGRGRFGPRRTVEWTASGAGQAPLRDGEPPYWERRWLQDCDCLAPRKVSQSFRPDQAIAFDADGMPLDYPTETFEYNDRHQMTAYLYADVSRPEDMADLEGACRKNAIWPTRETICWTKTYDRFERFSRLLTYTEPRSFDDNPIYRGMSFTHTYAYDTRFNPETGRFADGNRTVHLGPTVTRGVQTPQTIFERWTYNEHGQMTSHVDANDNLTTYTYFEGSRTGGGDVNTQGEFAGYIASMTRGAAGSEDPETDLTTTYRVNSIGMETRRTDPRSLVHETEYDAADEIVRELDPEVTLHNGQKVRYETRFVYDGAGNQVLRRRLNLEADGRSAVNEWVDRSQSFDAIGNLLSSRIEVDGVDGHDLVTRYRYDGNDDLAVVEQPEGNRTFHLYDERRLRFKTFFGVAPSRNGDAADGYPTDKRWRVLRGTDFVGFTAMRYDARRNAVRMRDGRAHLVHHVYDFYNREIGTSDQNGNGTVSTFDDASNVLTKAGGAVSAETGEATQVLERSYSRYDELGWRYQQVADIDLDSNEGSAVDPDDGASSSFETRFDAGSRAVVRIDAEGNETTMAFDAADRTTAVTDALGNERIYVYDGNSNVVRVEELEIPGPGASGPSELYVTENVFDALDRRAETHVLGLNGNSIDHETLFSFDSRNNTRLVVDAEGNSTRTTFDDADRPILVQRFDGDPGARGVPPGVTELTHREMRYDRNSRRTHDIVRSDVDDPESAQATLTLFDDLDRPVITVYPDADDYRRSPTGPGYLQIELSNPDGADGVYDRVDMTYDANSNAIRTEDQRRVVFHNTYDPGNRLVTQGIDLPASVPGTTRQQYAYDALDRSTAAANDYALVTRAYDALSRMVAESQSIRLDGGGFSEGWDDPTTLTFGYDRQSNRTAMSVFGAEGPVGTPDLTTAHTFDALNRVDTIEAAYFDRSLGPVAGTAYLGPGRVELETLGNGATLVRSYDTKRRVSQHGWFDLTGNFSRVLMSFGYDYDDVDNPLFETFHHDGDRADNYRYNPRYELTGLEYRDGTPRDYRVDAAAFGTTFTYDDNFNRRRASFGDPFGNTPNTEDRYAIDRANEYTRIDRSIGTEPVDLPPPLHDAAGNMVRFPARPARDGVGSPDVSIEATWDAFNLLFTATVPGPSVGNPELTEGYRYGPLGRRIAKLNLSDDGFPGRRYIYDGWSVVEERLLSQAPAVPVAAQDVPASTTDRLERIYVNGAGIDEPLLAAIDGDGDGDLDGGALPLNTPDGTDFEYYFLDNRQGSIMGLLDAAAPSRVLEYTRYSAYGEPTILPIVDDGSAPGSVAGDGMEDTPEDLADNDALSSGHLSHMANSYQFNARRLDEETGLYYNRARYFEPELGRFLQRDPWTGSDDAGNLFFFVANAPLTETDPSGNCPGAKCCSKDGTQKCCCLPGYKCVSTSLTCYCSWVSGISSVDRFTSGQRSLPARQDSALTTWRIARTSANCIVCDLCRKPGNWGPGCRNACDKCTLLAAFPQGSIPQRSFAIVIEALHGISVPLPPPSIRLRRAAGSASPCKGRKPSRPRSPNYLDGFTPSLGALGVSTRRSWDPVVGSDLGLPGSGPDTGDTSSRPYEGPTSVPADPNQKIPRIRLKDPGPPEPGPLERADFDKRRASKS